ncbi:MAG: HYR domain-containing protein [Crenarchaeota archaeon]|nr:MAG: HYR domain-containing protein [Thermoproteota archaeon]
MKSAALLVILFSVILVGSAPVFASTSSSHPFILKWGESGLNSPGKFSNPQNIAIDSSDNVYVTDLGNKRVQKFSSSGGFLKAWGSSGSDPGKFSSPSGITTTKDAVFVVDSQLHKVQKFDLEGNFILQWGIQGSNPGEFLLPNGIASDKSGMIFVVDTGNHRIQKFDSDGNFISSFGKSGISDDKFVSPLGIAIDPAGNIYVSDTGDNSIKKFDSNGNFVSIIDSSVGGTAIKVQGITIDPEGNLYAVDTGSDRVLRFNTNGIAISVWGSMGIQPGQFKMPKDVTLDSKGNLYIVDTNGHRIQKFGTPIVIQQQTSTPVTPKTQTVTTPLPTVNPIPGDLTKPIIVPPNDLIIEATGALTPVNVGQAVATDASGIKSLENNAPDKFTLGINTVIWTAIDGSGNMAIATQKVTVSDTIPPTISPMPSITVEAENPNQNTVELAEPAVSDTVGVLSITNDAPEFFTLGTTEVTWIASDIMGNTASTVQTINVVDTTNPSLYVPENVIVEADSLDKNQVYLGEATVIDNGQVLSITNDAPEFFKIGNYTVTWMASDTSGNIATDVQLVSIIDTQPPEIVFPETIIVEATSVNSNVVTLDKISVSDIQGVKITNDAPNVFPIGDTIGTWTAIDESGNSSNVEQIVSVVDTTAPSITVPDDLIVEASGFEGNIVNLGDVIVEDVGSIASITNDAPESFSLGKTIVTWTVSDIHGNISNSEQIINVIDTQPPEITAPADIELEASSKSDNSVALGQPIVNDLVDIASITNDAPKSFPIGMTTVTWTAVDTSGNESVDIQTITISDTISPEITAPEDLKIEAVGPNPVTVSLGETVTNDTIGIASITNDAPNMFPFGDTLVTWTATDLYGNSASDVQIVSIIDTTAPELNPPENITVEATSTTQNSVLLGSPKATDAVGVASITNDAPVSFPVGDTIITWTATDTSGNSVNAQQTVSVVDTIPPTISQPKLIKIEATSELDNQIELPTVNATDAVGVASITNDAPVSFPVGDTIITWTATDTSGNSVNAQQTVSVIDTTSPTLYVPKDKVVEATSLLSNIVEFGTATATDAVGVASITNDAPDVFPLGLTSITWTATDTSGNQYSAVQQIHVVDTTAPGITPPESITIEAESLQNNKVDLGQPIVSDQVKLDFVTNDAPASFSLGETIVTWTATDSSGNIVNATQLVTLIDTQPPKITPPNDVILEATSLNGNIAELGMPVASDSVSDVIITNDAPSSFPVGDTIVTWTATDENGNSASGTQKVSIIDTTVPQIIIPDDITIEAVSPTENIIDIGLATATDLVEIASITNNAPSVFSFGNTEVTWTATDTSGNSITDIQMINVVDTSPPKLTVPKNVIVEATSISENIVNIGSANAVDIIQVESLSNDAPNVFQLGDTIITWTAIDQDGNSATATQKISVVDTTAPTITPPANIIVDATALETPITVGLASVSDIIDLEPTVTNDAPSVFPLGETIVTWTSSDSFGNVNNATQIVTVQACGKDSSSYNMIIGTPDDDVINGTPQADLIFALDGDDIIMGNKGNDCIFGGDGDDIIFGNEGHDTLIGDQGNDILKGQSGNDILNGLTGIDIIDGGDDVDSCTVSQADGDMVIKCE